MFVFPAALFIREASVSVTPVVAVAIAGFGVLSAVGAVSATYSL